MYTPDKWVIVRILGKDPHYRIFGSWYGGFTGSDSWRMNSGVEKVTEDGNHWVFHGGSGSQYFCHKEAYGVSSYGWSVLNSYVEKSNGLIDVLSEPGDVLNTEWKL